MRPTLLIAVAFVMLSGCAPDSIAVPAPQPASPSATSVSATSAPPPTATPEPTATLEPTATPEPRPPTPRPAPPPPPPPVIERPAPPATAEQFPASADVYSIPPAAGADNARFANITLPPEGWAQEELRRRGFAKDPSRKLIALDPGHGGPEVGSAHGSLAEKNVNLAIALQLRAMLEASGYQVIMTREVDGRGYWLPDDPELVGYNPLRADLQGRVDLVNAAGADLFVSIHNNGSTNRAEGGAEVWYDPTRAFAHDNYRLANAVLDGILGELAGAGYAATNRGLKNAATFRVFNGRTFSLFVLGNARTEPRRTRATSMPGVLGESLFMSNPTEGALLGEPRIQQAIARGYLRGVNAYFGR